MSLNRCHTLPNNIHFILFYKYYYFLYNVDQILKHLISRKNKNCNFLDGGSTSAPDEKVRNEIVPISMHRALLLAHPM